MFNRILLYSLIILHLAIVIGNIFAFFALPFLAPWYISIPLCTFLFWFTNERNLVCRLTELENKLRLRLNLPEIRGFIGHYLKRPLKKAWNYIKTKLKNGMN